MDSLKCCKNCSVYTLKEVCRKCGGKTESRAYKFRFKWLGKGPSEKKGKDQAANSAK